MIAIEFPLVNQAHMDTVQLSILLPLIGRHLDGDICLAIAMRHP